jgi:hypothetical protein
VEESAAAITAMEEQLGKGKGGSSKEGSSVLLYAFFFLLQQLRVLAIVLRFPQH